MGKAMELKLQNLHKSSGFVSIRLAQENLVQIQNDATHQAWPSGLAVDSLREIA